MIDGFIALYIFMLAAFTGYEVIGRVPSQPCADLKAIRGPDCGVITGRTPDAANR